MNTKHIERRYIKNYIERHFKCDVENQKIINNLTGDFFYANEVICEIVSVFGFSRDRVKFCVKKWVEANGIDWGKVGFGLRMYSAQVEAGERRIRTQWTPEMAADIAAYHNIDAEAELTAMLGNELAREMDRNIINQIADIQRNQHIDQAYDIEYVRNNLIRTLGIPRNFFNGIDIA